jgi:hypothetical protein
VDSGAPSPGASPTSTAASSSAEADALPEAVYRTAPLTAADIRAAATAGGFTDDEAAVVTDLFSESVVWELTLAGGRWTQSEIYDGAPAEVGWQGTYVVSAGDTVVATEDGGSAVTYDYALVGDELTLSLVDVPGDRDNLLHQTVIYQSGPFLRNGAPEDTAQQSVDEFVVPFTIQLADWLDPAPSQESPSFVTWESADHARALRVMAPVAVYRPGHTEPSPPPEDMGAYLTSLADAGAEISDVADTDVDGRPATEMTIGLPTGMGPGTLDGAIGCPEADQAADTCFGPQDDLLLRLVTVDVDGTPVLIWERDGRDDADALSDGTFDAMIASLRLD